MSNMGKSKEVTDYLLELLKLQPRGATQVPGC